MWNQYTRKYLHLLFIQTQMSIIINFSISEIITWRFFRPYITDFVFQFIPKGHEFQKHLNVVHDFTRKVIAERKKRVTDNQSNTHKNNNTEDDLLGRKKRMSFLDLLLESSDNGQVLNDQDIAEEVDTFMFEVFERLVHRQKNDCFDFFLGA